MNLITAVKGKSVERVHSLRRATVPEVNVTMSVRRVIHKAAAVDIRGEVTANRQKQRLLVIVLTPNAQGLSWACEDFVESDRTHPSKSGVAKVGKALLDFFTTSPYTRTWFLAPP